MNNNPKINRRDASWLDKREYPFASRFFSVPAGEMHYIDEGTGAEPIVFVHGNTSWSFLYRALIKCLSKTQRCIAIDHIGFGLSSKPETWSYLPKEHAENLERLLEHLNVTNITLVVQDWGGPIGLSYALAHPGKVKRLIIMNTWMWPVDDQSHFRFFSKLVGGPFGRWLIRRHNLVQRVLMKQLFGKKSRLKPLAHAHYIRPFDEPESRKATWVLPREIIGSTSWLRSLWEKRSAIANHPTLFLWGLKDHAFTKKELETFQAFLPNNRTLVFADVGHYVAEELGEKLCPVVQEFLKKGVGARQRRVTDMAVDLKNRVVLITGGGSGIGLALAREFLRRKNTVIICGRSAERLESARRENSKLHAYVCDITDAQSVKKMAADIEGKFGGIDFLVNNAGYSGITDLLRDPDAFHQVTQEMATNFFAPLGVIMEFLPQLMTKRDAMIVNITSGLAYVPMATFAGYCAAKSALHSFSRSLRTQLRGTSVRVVEILPPTVDTALSRGLEEKIGATTGKMTAKKFAAVAMRKLKKGEDEIRVGQTVFLNIIGRIAPRAGDAMFAKVTAKFFAEAKPQTS